MIFRPNDTCEHRIIGTDAVDGLRGVAVLLVFLYHTWLFSFLNPSLRLFGIELPTGAVVKTGYLGVDLFFILSGFCLYLPYARAARFGTAAPSVKTFYRRRILKIIPSYLLALSATTIVAAPVFPSQKDMFLSTLQHVFFLQNMVSPEILGFANSVLWSVAVEVQFYLVFPLLVFALRRSFWSVVVGLIVSSFVYRYLAASCCVAQEPIMRELPAYLDVFACGIVAAHIQTMLYAKGDVVHDRAPFTAGAVVLSLCGIAFFISADFATHLQNGREFWNVSMRPVFGVTAAALIVTSCAATERWKRIVANPALTGLSIISYNVYLWHTFIEIFLFRRHIIPSVTPDPHGDPTWQWTFYLVSIVLTLVVSIIITYFVEQPILSLLTPQRFAFDWKRLRQKFHVLPKQKAHV